MKSQTPDEYDHDDYDYDADLTHSENVIASRKCSFENLDSEYADALRVISMRVKCPRCDAQRKQLCRGTMNGEPAHKSRMKLLQFSFKKVRDNVRYAMRSEKWKGNDVLIKRGGKWEIVSTNDPQWITLVMKTYGDVCIDGK